MTNVQDIIDILQQEGINSKQKAIELLEEMKEADADDQVCS